MFVSIYGEVDVRLFTGEASLDVPKKRPSNEKKMFDEKNPSWPLR